jgi:hypothetical protein
MQVVADFVYGLAVEATFERINGTTDRPLVYLFVSVREKAASLNADELAAQAPR